MEYIFLVIKSLWSASKRLRDLDLRFREIRFALIGSLQKRVSWVQLCGGSGLVRTRVFWGATGAVYVDG